MYSNRQHEVDGVVEIRHLELRWLLALEEKCCFALRKVFEDMDGLRPRLFHADVRKDVDEAMVSLFFANALTPCQDILKKLSFFGSLTCEYDTQATSSLARKLALLLDIAVVSYVRSRGSGFDEARFLKKTDSLEVSGGGDTFSFSSSWVKRACLDSFLDGREVPIFRLSEKNAGATSQEQLSPTRAHVLTRIQDLADLWGPIYTVRSADGLIEYYGVSKGAICRVKASPSCRIQSAIPGHYSSRRELFRRKKMAFTS